MFVGKSLFQTHFLGTDGHLSRAVIHSVCVIAELFLDWLSTVCSECPTLGLTPMAKYPEEQ